MIQTRKNAYGYGRISTKGQSTYSIPSQIEDLKLFADIENLNLLDIFVDDGRSGKNFNRPAWRKLERALSKNRLSIDYLVVPCYDRFGRNAMECLNMIEKIENRWNIIILSATEPLPRDYESPSFFMARSQLLLNAEFERRKIQQRTKRSLYKGYSNGRKLHRAGYGWKNSRDENGKSILVQVPQEVEIVKFIIDCLKTELPVKTIHEVAIGMGYTRRGNDAIKRTALNCSHYGLVRVPAYKDIPEKIIKAVQPGFLPPEDYFLMVKYFTVDDPKPRHILDNEMYLRGVVQCEACGHKLTAGRSKGNTKWYVIYRCNYCRCQNHNAIYAHPEFEQILSDLSIPSASFNRILKIATTTFKKQQANKKHLSTELKQKLKAAESKLMSLEEKYIAEQIPTEMFSRWYPTYKKEISDLRRQLAGMGSRKVNHLLRLKVIAEKFKQLDKAFLMLDVAAKHRFVKTMFPGGLYRNKKGYTTFLPPLLSFDNNHKISHLSIVEKKRTTAISDPRPVRVKDGSSIQLNDIQKIKLVADIFLNTKVG